MNQIRVAVVGVEETGKTELLRSFCDSLRVGDLLTEKSELVPKPSVFVPKRTFYKTVQFENDKVEVIFEERGVKYLSNLRDVNACIFLYDVTDTSSFEVINDLVIPEDWKLERKRRDHRYPVFLVGSKLDLVERRDDSFRYLRTVKSSEVLKFSWEKNVIHKSYETSLYEYKGQKEEQKLRNIFMSIIHTIFQQQRMDRYFEYEDQEQEQPMMEPLETTRLVIKNSSQTPSSKYHDNCSSSIDTDTKKSNIFDEVLIQERNGYTNIEDGDNKLYGRFTQQQQQDCSEGSSSSLSTILSQESVVAYFSDLIHYIQNFCSSSCAWFASFDEVILGRNHNSDAIQVGGVRGRRKISRLEYEEILPSERNDDDDDDDDNGSDSMQIR